MPATDASLDYARRIQRDYGTGAQILSSLKLKNIRLLTNHPRRIVGLEGYGIKVVEQIPIKVPQKVSESLSSST